MHARTYVELREGDAVRKVVTEQQRHYSATLVFNEFDSLELLELSFADDVKQRNIWTIEVRQRKDAAPLGSTFLTDDYIERLETESTEFKEWMRGLLSSRSAGTAVKKGFVVLTDPQTGSDGETSPGGEPIPLMAIKDLLCACSDGKVMAHCFVSTLRCAVDNLCSAWDCVESGEWTESCRTDIAEAERCLLKGE